MNAVAAATTLSPDQLECWQLLCDLVGGEHHLPKVQTFGSGIKATLPRQSLATFDFGDLTDLVILAHDRCIRAEVLPGGPGRIAVALWKRDGREGPMHRRHPTIEEAIKRVRGEAA